MKVPIHLPPLVLELPDGIKYPKSVAEQWQRWLERWVVTWGWKKFVSKIMPQLDGNSSAQFERDAIMQSTRMLKPQAGESAVDLFSKVAESSWLDGVVPVIRHHLKHSHMTLEEALEAIRHKIAPAERPVDGEKIVFYDKEGRACGLGILRGRKTTLTHGHRSHDSDSYVRLNNRVRVDGRESGRIVDVSSGHGILVETIKGRSKWVSTLRRVTVL